VRGWRKSLELLESRELRELLGYGAVKMISEIGDIVAMGFHVMLLIRDD